jgi:hypothetical protein
MANPRGTDLRRREEELLSVSVSKLNTPILRKEFSEEKYRPSGEQTG